MSWLSVCLGLLAGNAEAARGLTFFVLFLPYLSSAFVPTDTMPKVLRAIADHQPITPIIETVRGLLIGTPIGSSGCLALAWCTGLLLVSYIGTWHCSAAVQRTDRWRTRLDRGSPVGYAC